MPMRITGMNSGMDIDSIIKELVAVRQVKVDSVKKEQTKLEWKQEAWRDLNTKVNKFFNGTLSNLRFYSSYAKKLTRISNPGAVKVETGDGAMNSVQGLKIRQLAKAGYLTGAQVSAENGGKITSSSKAAEALGIQAGSTFEVSSGGTTRSISINEDTTVGSLVSQMREGGINASFDEKNQRFFLSSLGTGAEKDFSVVASNAGGTEALSKMGILVYDTATVKSYQEYANMATDATLKQAAMDKETAKRAAGLADRRDSLNKSLTEYEKTKESFELSYEVEFGEEISAADKDAIKAQIQTLEEKEDRSEEENLELLKLQSRVYQIEKYEGAIEDISRTQASLSDVAEYIDEEGNATDKLKGDVLADFNGKIAHAQTVLEGDMSSVSGASRVEAQDAIIELNDATFTGGSNTFEINGLTITAQAVTGDEEITLTTEDDTSGIYDMIKGFIKEYSSIINEMDKLYNAESARKYEPLTEDEKNAMSEKEIEKWEAKIKDSLLRRDGSLNEVSSLMKSIMSDGYSVNGKTMRLADFGIDMMNFLEAAANEKNAYHINGDEDDPKYSNKANDLKAMIAADPKSVSDFFVQLAQTMNTRLNTLMRSSDYRSAFKIYDDKSLKKEQDSYTSKIATLEKQLLDYENKWYAKFGAMETAMAKMQSNASAVTSLLGG